MFISIKIISIFFIGIRCALFLAFFARLLFATDYNSVNPVITNLKKQKHRESIFIKAEDEFSKKHYIRAYKLFMLSDAPKSVKLFNAGLSLERAGRYEEAFKIYKRLGTIDSFYRMSVCCTAMNKWICVVKYLELWHQNKKSIFYDFEYSARLGIAYLNLNSLNYAEKYLKQAKNMYIKQRKALEKDANIHNVRTSRLDVLGLNSLHSYALLNIKKADAIKLVGDIKARLNEKFAYYLEAENTYLELVKLGDIFTANKGLYELAIMYISIYDKFTTKERGLKQEIDSLLTKAELVLTKNLELSKRLNLRNSYTIDSSLLLTKIRKRRSRGGQW